MTPMTDPNLVVAVLRVSTNEQAESGLGLEAQEASIRAYASANGLELVSIHTDAGVSGRAELTDRPGLVAALGEIVSRRAGVLLVAKLDRLARDPFLVLTIEKALNKSGARLVSAAGEGTHGDDPSQVLMRHILMGVSAHEAALVSSRTSAAMRAKAARGERLGRPPKGFKVEAGVLVPNEDFPAVRRCLELREAGLTYRAIQAELGWNLNTIRLVVKRWNNSKTLLAATVPEAPTMSRLDAALAFTGGS